MKDLWKEFDKRLKIHEFKARIPSNTVSEKTDIVKLIYEHEYGQKFRSADDRMLYRIDLWGKVNNFRQNGNEYISQLSQNKRNKQSVSTLTKLRAYSLKFASRSVDGLDNIHDKKVFSQNNYRMIVNQGQLSTANQLFYRGDELDSKTASDEVINTSDKYGTTPKRRFKFVLFRKKEKSLDEQIYNKNMPSDNIGSHSFPMKRRPSIFEMNSINGSVSNFNTIEFNEIDEYEFDPSDKRFNSLNRSEKFHTVSAPQHENVFNGIRQDSLRHKQQHVVSEELLKTKKEAYIGQI